MIYAIIPFREEEELRHKIDALDTFVYDDEAPKAYFVSYKGTTRELAEAIGYNEPSSVGTGIVIPVPNYFGYASKHLWEWLNVHEKNA